MSSFLFSGIFNKARKYTYAIRAIQSIIDKYNSMLGEEIFSISNNTLLCANGDVSIFVRQPISPSPRLVFLSAPPSVKSFNINVDTKAEYKDKINAIKDFLQRETEDILRSRYATTAQNASCYQACSKAHVWSIDNTVEKLDAQTERTIYSDYSVSSIVPSIEINTSDMDEFPRTLANYTIPRYYSTATNTGNIHYYDGQSASAVAYDTFIRSHDTNGRITTNIT